MIGGTARRSDPPGRSVQGVAGGLGLGLAAGWNVANTGAIAEVLDDAYGVRLSSVGLLTTALFLTHLAAQVPGGRLVDRFGARRLGVAALAVIIAGNALAAGDASFGLALAARSLTGLGTGAAFVAGSDAVRAAAGSPTLQGVFGGVSVGGGGLALALVPVLEHVLAWRAPYVSAIVLAAAVVPLLLAADAEPRTLRPQVAVRASVLRDRRLYRFALIHTATFGVAVVLGNWVVSLLVDDGFSREAAGTVGGFLLLGGLATRPLGGWLIRMYPAHTTALVAGSLAATALGVAALASGGPRALVVAGSALAGLAAGIPFAAAFTGAQRARPDAPAAAIGVVNGTATLAIVAGTPLLGLLFSIGEGGRLGFLTAAALILASAAVAARRAGDAPGEAAA